MIMCRPKESKTVLDRGKPAPDKTEAFPSTALRVPTLAALKNCRSVVSSAFPSTAFREPILRLIAAQGER
jgi:hypothetical protein